MTQEQTQVTFTGLDRQRALKYFEDSQFDSRCLEIWHQTMPGAIERIQPAVIGLPQPELENWLRKLHNSPQAKLYRSDLNRLAGTVFEHLALSYFITQNTDGQKTLYETSVVFDEILRILGVHPELSIKPHQNNGYFGTSISWQDRGVLIIPDGFIGSTNSDKTQIVISELLESQLTGRSKNPTPFTRLAEFLYSNPEILARLSLLLSGVDSAQLAHPSQLRHLLLVPADISDDDIQMMEKRGWKVTKTSLNRQDAFDKTVSILRSFPPQAA